MKKWLRLVAGFAATGVAVGALWSWLAPSIHGVVAVTKSGRRVHDYIGNEADHYFDAAVIMAGMLVGVGVVSAVLMWQWRQHRGPAMVLGLTLGSIATAAAAVGTGTGLARLRYGHTDIEAIPADQKIHYITEAPSTFFGNSVLQVLTTLLLPAAAAAITFAMMAAASADDDLGVDVSLPEPVPTLD